MAEPIIKSGSVSLTGSDMAIQIGCHADVVYFRTEDGTARYIWHWTKSAWTARATPMGDHDSALKTVFDVTRDGVLLLGSDSQINVAGGVLHWLAIDDNDSGYLSCTGWIGSLERPTTYKAHVFEKEPIFIHVKRDSGIPPAVWAKGISAGFSVLAGSPPSLMNDAILSVSASGAISCGANSSVNQITGSSIGEGHMCVTYADSPYWSLVEYVGDGTTGRNVSSGGCAALVISNGTQKGGFVTDKMSTAATFAQEISGNFGVINASSFIVGGIWNATGVKYWALVLKANEAIRNYLPLKFTSENVNACMLRGVSSQVNCGNSDSLSFAAGQPYALEWWGELQPLAQTNIAMMMYRSAGAELRGYTTQNNRNKVSWGLFAYRYNDLGDWAGGQICVVITDYNSHVDSTEADVRCKPWRTGILMPRRPCHILVTTDGVGGWYLFLDGVLVKERHIDMRNVLTVTESVATGARTNAGAGVGHTTGFGGRWDGAAWGMSTKSVLMGANIYNKLISISEVKALFRKNFCGDSSQITPSIYEGWDFANMTNSSLPAKVNSANNGTISNGYKVNRFTYSTRPV